MRLNSAFADGAQRIFVCGAMCGQPRREQGHCDQQKSNAADDDKIGAGTLWGKLAHQRQNTRRNVIPIASQPVPKTRKFEPTLLPV